jgi:CheY-like chemotaxis protein
MACVLLAENDVSNRKVTALMLKRLGYSTDTVTNGKEVLRAIKHQPYDIVLMNVRLPELDGFEATRKIRERCPAAVQPKIIALTAYILPNSRERCLEAGMDDFMAKPVKIEDLAAMLSKHTRISDRKASLSRSREEAFSIQGQFPGRMGSILPFGRDYAL